MKRRAVISMTSGAAFAATLPALARPLKDRFGPALRSKKMPETGVDLAHA